MGPDVEGAETTAVYVALAMPNEYGAFSAWLDEPHPYRWPEFDREEWRNDQLDAVVTAGSKRPAQLESTYG